MFNSKLPTAFLLGRYQPFHAGHEALVKEAIDRVGQVVIAVRDTQGTSEKDPLSAEDVEQRIHAALEKYSGKYKVIHLPNITNIFYGRDVGYEIERLHLGSELEQISATKIRKEQGI